VSKKAKKKKKGKKNRELLMYVLDPKTRQRVGVVVARQEGPTIHYGWSQCMIKPTQRQKNKGITKGDRFDKVRGKNIARGRAKQAVIHISQPNQLHFTSLREQMNEAKVPHACRVALRRLGTMVIKYFKR